MARKSRKHAQSNHSASSKRQWKRNTLTGAIALALSAVPLSAVYAQPSPCSSTISAVLSSTCSLTGNSSTTITNTGAVSVSNLSAVSAINIYNDAGISLTNDGSIKASGSSSAAGVYVSGNLVGMISNNGAIDARANPTSSSIDAAAFGVDVSGVVYGALSNSSTGTISASAHASGSYAYADAYGLNAGGFKHQLTNAGTISANATYTGTRGTAVAYGIETNSLDGGLINTGTISATADVNYASGSASYPSAYATAVGLDVNTVTGNLSNNGYILASAYNSATSSAYASARGIDITTGMVGNLSNNGAISATATAESGAKATGIYIDTLVGNLSNTGTVSASATSFSSDATANGIEIGTLNGAFSNSGNISAIANATSGGSAYAYAVDMGYMGAGITNTGTISASASAAYHAAAEGLYLGSTVNGNGGSAGIALSNAGTIQATANSSSSDAYAAGIYVNADARILGGVSNSGLISATANAYSNAYAAGIYLSDTNIISGNGTTGVALSNSGTISATADSLNSDAYATGIYTDDLVLTGTLSNTGLISAHASAYGWAEAIGINIAESSGALSGNGTTGAAISNSGTIKAVANSLSSEAEATGLYVDSKIIGGVSNSGLISASATGVSNAYAYAVSLVYGTTISGDIAGTGAAISNSGTIQATAKASDGYAYATGLYSYDYLKGGLSNSGLISASATGKLGASATAVSQEYTVTGNLAGTGAAISNSGTIQATATASSGKAYADAVYTDYDINGAVSNSGLISASASGKLGAKAYGLDLTGNSTVTGTLAGTGAAISNSGTIQATANSTSGYADAYALYSDDVINGGVSNSGLISASASAKLKAVASAVYLSYTVNGNLAATGAAISNTGTIKATANSTSNEADAFGLFTGDNIYGGIANSGLILASASAYDYAFAIGVSLAGAYELSGNITGTGAALSNSGTIQATANSSNSEAEAYGIYAYDHSIAGGLSNSGLISASATGKNYAYAVGISLSYGYPYQGGTITGNIAGTGAAISNSGTIQATANSLSSDAYAYGIDSDYKIYGGIANSGLISASAFASSKYASAVGLYLNYGVSGTLTSTGAAGAAIDNSGTIQATAKALSSEAEAYGIYSDDYVYGGILNSGLISASATGKDYAYAAGLSLGYGVSGTLTSTGAVGAAIDNSGTIQATANSSSSEASAYGIYSYYYGYISGGILNTGLISASASAHDYASAAGLYLYYGVSGTLASTGAAIDNSGTIQATANSSSSEAYAYGIYSYDDYVSGGILNTGLISASASAHDYASAAGLYLKYGVTGTLTSAGAIGAAIDNSGTIQATANSSSSDDAYAYGIYSDDYIDGGILNSGLISASASASDHVSAEGLYLADGVSDVLTSTGAAIDNSGTIQATANSLSSEAYAYGIYSAGDISGGIANSGLISASASAYDYAYAAGLYLYYGVSGTLTSTGAVGAAIDNSGTIQATANSSNEAEAYGIYSTDDYVSGGILNTGLISASASAYTYASAAGLYLGYGVTGTLTSAGAVGAAIDNSGTIQATANSLSSEAYAYGIYSASDISGGIANSGLISASASAYTYASADGLYIDGSVSGNLSGTGAAIDNSGTIQATANSSNSDAEAYGIISYGHIYGGIANSGLISASASAHDYAYAEALYLDYGVSGTLTSTGAVGAAIDNSGTIQATANSLSSKGYAYGIYSDDYIYGGILNSGVISASASAHDKAYAEALDLYYGVSGSLASTGAAIDNSGTIQAIANSSSSDAYAYGIYSYNDISGGGISNSGLISANASGNDHAYAAALYISGSVSGNLSGTGTGAAINNSGTIQATAKSTSGYATAYGLYQDGDITGGILNSGLISASVSAKTDAYAYGIDLNGYSNTLTNNASNTIVALNNTGTIQATANLTSGYADAYAILSNDSVEGGIANSGTIAAAASGSGANAFGMEFGAQTMLISGSIANAGAAFNNTGIISARATARAPEDANAQGLGFSASHLSISSSIASTSAAIVNAGTIQAIADSSSGSADATGISANARYATINGGLSNTGLISASASAYDRAIAEGISFGYHSGPTSISGLSINANVASSAAAITNSGVISAIATSTSSYADAYGMVGYAYHLGVNGGISNSGTINVKASAYDTAYALGIGFGGLSASITANTATTGPAISNSGLIDASANSSTSNADAAGISIFGYYSVDIVGGISNTGLIHVSANAYDHAYALGIGIDPHFSAGSATISVNNASTGAAINNTGLISATADSSNSSASAYGIVAHTDINGGLANSGVISAMATGHTNVYASGIDADSVYENSLTGMGFNNTGTIIASATASGVSSVSAVAYGLDVGTLTGDFTNTGTISATAHAVASSSSGHAYAYGVDLGTYDGGTFTNSGTISGVSSDPAEGYSLYIGSGTGSINNLAGGVLNGNLYIGSSGIDVSNAGSIIIPVLSTPATIAGNYTQESGGLLTISAASSTEYGALSVGGIADVSATNGNNLEVHATPTNTLAVGDVLDVLTAGTLTGPALSVTGTPMFTYQSSASGNTEEVTITSKTTIAGVLGQTSGSAYTNLGNTLDTLAGQYTGNGPIDPLILALYDTNSASELTNDVKQLAPQAGMDLGRGFLGTLQNLNGIIQGRQDLSLGLSSGGAYYNGKYFWVMPFASHATQGNRDNVSGYTANSSGVVLGLDGKLGDSNNRLGAAFSYATSRLTDSAVDQNGTIDAYQLNLYGTYHLDARTQVDFQAGYGVLNNKENRSVAVGSVVGSNNASFNGSTAHLGVSANHVISYGKTSSLTPSIYLTYNQIHTDGYTESGSLAQLNVNSNNTDELILGANAGYAHALSQDVKFEADIGAGYDTLAKRDSITASFVNGGPAFSTKGINPSAWIANGGLGLVYTSPTGGMQLSANYNISQRFSDFTNQTASLKVKIPF